MPIACAENRSSKGWIRKEVLFWVVVGDFFWEYPEYRDMKPPIFPISNIVTWNLRYSLAKKQSSCIIPISHRLKEVMATFESNQILGVEVGGVATCIWTMAMRLYNSTYVNVVLYQRMLTYINHTPVLTRWTKPTSLSFGGKGARCKSAFLWHALRGS